jgi:acetyltransferase-like isoleucine patch superfamily enzyme
MSDYSIKDYILHGIFFSLYGWVKYIPSPLGDVLRFIFVKPFIRHMGKVRIREGVTFWYPYRIHLADNITLNELVYLSGYGTLLIENGVRIGHRTSIITSDHRFDNREIPIRHQGIEPGKVHIESDVLIGCNVTILKDVTIGKGAVIAAGSVVTENVPRYAIMAGVPAKKIAERETRP